MFNTVKLHLVQNLKRVGERIGDIGEDVVHLLLALKPLLLRISHAVGVVEVGLSGKTKQVVVGLGGLFVLKMAVVGADEFDTVFFGKLYQHLVGPLLQGIGFAIGENRGVSHFVALQLEIVVVAEHPMIPLAGFARTGDVAFQYFGGYFAGYTGRADDQVFMIFLQIFAVGTRPIVVTVHPRTRDELDEILVPVVVLANTMRW